MQNARPDKGFLAIFRVIFSVKNRRLNHSASMVKNRPFSFKKLPPDPAGFKVDFWRKTGPENGPQSPGKFRLTEQTRAAMSPDMAALDLSKLLALQESDSRRLALEQQLQAAPREIAAVEPGSRPKRPPLRPPRPSGTPWNRRRSCSRWRSRAPRTRRANTGTQQLEVRKNDEYKALTHEIETTEAAISGFEEEELKVMYTIDEAKKRFAAAEAELKQNITGHEGKIRTLHERETQLQAELKEAQAAVAAARPAVPASQLKIYDRVALKPGHPCA